LPPAIGSRFSTMTTCYVRIRWPRSRSQSPHIRTRSSSIPTRTSSTPTGCATILFQT
jgi:hypothetical protein